MSAAEMQGNPRPAERSPATDPGLAALLTGIFQEWTRAGIVFLILRNYQDLPATTTNDVDVLVGPDQIARAEEVMIRAATQCGYLLHNRVEFATLACYFFHPGSLAQVQIDLFSSLKWHTFKLFPVVEVLARRVQRPLFAIPHPLDEALVSLVSPLIYQGQVREKYRPGILSAFQSHADQARARLAEIFGAALAGQMVDLSLREEWELLERLARRLRRALVRRCLLRHPFQTAASILGDGLRLCKRLRYPAGLMVAVLGADGSGKSTVGGRVVEMLKNTFKPGKMLEVHWKPVVFFRSRRRPTGQPNVNPHGRPPRGPVASLAYLLGHWLEFLLGAQFQFRPVLFRNGLVLVDRYYYDFLVDPRRYRLQAPHWLIKAMFWCIRKPDLVFLLDAPPEVLQSRKQEVPLAESARQVAAYRELVRKLPQGRILDATQRIDQVAAAMAGQILEHLRQRAGRRREGGPGGAGVGVAA